jgi:hypothetical protein
MPKLTAKYAAAWRFAGSPEPKPDAEMLYAHMRGLNHWWNSEAKVWEYHDPAEANPPMEGIAIRVWADARHAEKAAVAVAHALRAVYGWRLVETSAPYPCRPPEQLESRVYLKFMPKEG